MAAITASWRSWKCCNFIIIMSTMISATQIVAARWTIFKQLLPSTCQTQHVRTLGRILVPHSNIGTDDLATHSPSGPLFKCQPHIMAPMRNLHNSFLISQIYNMYLRICFLMVCRSIKLVTNNLPINKIIEITDGCRTCKNWCCYIINYFGAISTAITMPKTNNVCCVGL